MTNNLQYIVILGAIVQLIGAFSYIKEMMRGHAKPNKVSWLLWASSPLIATVAALSSGVTWAVLPVFMSGFGPLCIFLLSFFNKKAYWKLEKFDYLCGVSSVLALVLWAITKEPLVAILLSILSDGLASIPTLVKAWKYPETEGIGPFVGSLFSSSLSFIVAKTWSMTELAFPFYLVVIDVLLILAVKRKQIQQKIDTN